MNKQIFFIFYGAGSGAQTRDLRLGKATLYQLSYSRKNTLTIITKINKKVNRFKKNDYNYKK